MEHKKKIEHKESEISIGNSNYKSQLKNEQNKKMNKNNVMFTSCKHLLGGSRWPHPF